MALEQQGADGGGRWADVSQTGALEVQDYVKTPKSRQLGSGPALPHPC